MSMNSPHESAKDVLRDLWKDKPLLLAVVVFILVALYLVYKYSQSSLIAPAATASASTPTGGSFSNTSITKTVTQTGPGQPTPAPPPKTPKSGWGVAVIRAKQSSGIDAGWDKTHAGVPIRTQPSGYNDSIVRLIAFGKTIPLVGPVLSGGLNQQGGSTQWYPVSGGYLSAWDIASIKGGA